MFSCSKKGDGRKRNAVKALVYTDIETLKYKEGVKLVDQYVVTNNILNFLSKLSLDLI